MPKAARVFNTNFSHKAGGVRASEEHASEALRDIIGVDGGDLEELHDKISGTKRKSADADHKYLEDLEQATAAAEIDNEIAEAKENYLKAQLGDMGETRPRMIIAGRNATPGKVDFSKVGILEMEREHLVEWIATLRSEGLNETVDGVDIPFLTDRVAELDGRDWHEGQRRRASK